MPIDLKILMINIFVFKDPLIPIEEKNFVVQNSIALNKINFVAYDLVCIIKSIFVAYALTVVTVCAASVLIRIIFVS